MTVLTEESATEFMQRKSREFAAKPVVPMKDVGGAGTRYYVREAWTFLPQSNLAENKVFVVERLRKERFDGDLAFSEQWRKGDIEYRLGYYIRRPRGIWRWGQYCPLVPAGDLAALLDKARREGTVR